MTIGLAAFARICDAGSLVQFSLLPYEPATGNFTHVVQRLPVRIRLILTRADARRLRPGLSAEVKVRLKD